MGTCGQEGKPCSEYPLWIFPQSVNRISNEYPRAISWISDEPEIEYWSFPSSVHQCVTSSRWSSDNFGWIEFWSKHWNLGASDTRLPVNCIGSVSEVSQDYPLWLELLQSCVQVCGYWRPEHKIQSSVQIQSCVQNSLSSAHSTLSIMCIFCPAGFCCVDVLYFPHCRSVVRVSAGAHTAWRTLDVWTTKPIAFNVRPDKIHRRSY